MIIMSNINDLIKEMCPNGVSYIELYKVVKWNKRFSDVNKEWQKEILTLKSNVSAQDLKRLLVKNGDIKLLSTGNFDGYTDRNTYKGLVDKAEVITIPSGGSANIKYYNGEFVNSGNILGASSNTDIYYLKYIYHCLLKNNDLIQSYFRGSSVQHPEMKQIIQIKIPIPPIEIQKEIVRILDKFVELESELELKLKAELELRNSQYKFWSVKLLSQKNEIRKLSEVSNVIDSLHATPKYVDSGYPMIRVADVKGGIVNTTDALKVDVDTYRKFISKYKPQKGDIIISRVGSFGNTCIVGDEDMCLGQNISVIHPIINCKYLYYYLSSDAVQDWIKNNVNGAGYKSLSLANINEIPIAVPSFEEQQKIANILDKFNKLVNDISVGLPVEIELRRKQYEYYRNKLLSFEELKNE